MRRRSLRTTVLYSVYVCATVTITSLFGNMAFNQMVYVEKFAEHGPPKPRATKPKWCSDAFDVDITANYPVQDLFSVDPPPFEENYKNPCFFDACHYLGDREVQKLRCLPYFHVLGVDKCGSTDLYHRIVQHPQIRQNDGVLNKETQWWSWKRYGQFLNHSFRNSCQTFDRYLQYFDNAAGQINAISYLGQNGQELPGHQYPVITGDGTPMDFWDFSGWPKIPQNKNLSEPKILTPHLMKRVNPNVKLILVFRRPTERLYSDYLFLGLGSPTPKSFHKKVLRALDKFKKCKENHTARWCLFSRDIHATLPVRLHVGAYSVFLMEWLEVFPMEQFLVLRSEDYSKDIKGTMSKVFKFLEVDELPDNKLNEIAQIAREYQTAKKVRAGRMLRGTRKLLDDFYAPFNRQLTALMNDFKYIWNDTQKKDHSSSSASGKRLKHNVGSNPI